jgi:hypothetical protein
LRARSKPTAKQKPKASQTANGEGRAARLHIPCALCAQESDSVGMQLRKVRR